MAVLLTLGVRRGRPAAANCGEAVAEIVSVTCRKDQERGGHEYDSRPLDPFACAYGTTTIVKIAIRADGMSRVLDLPVVF